MRDWTLRGRAWLYKQLPYWHLRSRLIRARFFVQHWLSGAQRRVEDGGDWFAPLLAFLRGSLGMIIVAGLFSALIQFGLGPLLSCWLPTLDDGSYGAVLQVVASVTGIFLALHFASLSSVIGLSYGRATDDIRSLVLQEKAGEAYVWILVFVTATAVCLLGFRALDQPPQAAAVILLVPLAIASMVAFARLTRVHFAMLDPSNLAGIVLRRLTKTSMLPRVTRSAWNQSEFQLYYQRIAAQDLTTLSALRAAAQSMQGDSDLRVTLAGFRSASAYLANRSTIPPSSGWFPKRQSHPRWNLVEPWRANIATATSTPLMPDLVPDYTWYEDRFLELGLAEVGVLSKESDEVALAQCMKGMCNLFANLGQFGEGRNCLEWAQRYKTLVLDAVGTRDDAVALATIDALALLPVNAWLGFSRSLDGLREAPLREVARALRWQDLRKSFPPGLPHSVATAADQLRTRLRFERAVESGVTVTPEWYVLSQLKLAGMRHVAENLDAYNLTIAFYTQTVQELCAAKKWRAAWTFANEGLQFTNKMLAQLDDCLQLFEELKPDSNADSYSPPTINSTQLRTDIKAAEEDLSDALSRLIPKLGSERVADTRLPDLLGPALRRTAETLLDRLRREDEAGVRRTLGYYFTGAFLLSEQLRDHLEEDASPLIQFGPVLDLLSLSGIAFAWSELHQRPGLWDPWRQLWDNYLGQNSAAERAVAGLVFLKRRSLSPGGIHWRSWIRPLVEEMRGLPRSAYLGVGRPFSRVRHPSALIRLLGDDRHHPSHDGVDIFVSRYLVSRPGASQLDFGGDTLTGQLTREEAQGQPEESNETNGGD